LKARGVKTLSAIICTHPHEDHIGGMPSVINAFGVDAVYMPKASTTTQAFEKLLLAIKAKGLTIATAAAGTRISIDPLTTMQFLAPLYSSFEDLNDYSAVLRVTRGAVSFLFMGDASMSVEDDILGKNADIRTDVLKVGHHGSATSSDFEFLASVHPEYAAIEVGEDNTYGHPAADVLSRLKAVGAVVYRSDLDGSVVFTTNGERLTVDKQPSTLPAPAIVDPLGQDIVYRTVAGLKYHRLGSSYRATSSITVLAGSEANALGWMPWTAVNP
jgi:competence protein ComEC